MTAAQLHGASDVADHVHRLSGAECSRVLGDGRYAVGDSAVEAGGVLDDPDVLDAGLLVGAPRAVQVAVGDGDELHPRRAADDLRRHPAAPEAGADHAHPHGAISALAGLKRAVDEDHC